MKKIIRITERELLSLINESICRLNESNEKKEIEDFFNMLEVDPNKNTFAHIYYVSSLGMNKNIIDENGVKIINPMYGKIFKNSLFKFNYGKTYIETVLKKNPEWEIQKRNGTYENVDGYSIIKIGKEGKLTIDVVEPTTVSSSYIYHDGETTKLITYDEIKPYLKPKTKSKTVSGSGIDMKVLIVDKVYRLSAGGHIWNNPHFIFKEFKSFLK